MQTSHDSSTHAMTEVALGLSMAFFSILILALLSMSVPQKDVSKAESTDSQESVELSPIALSNSENEQTDGASTQRLVFYYQGQLYSRELQKLDLPSLQDGNDTVIAVPENIAFVELMRLKKSFAQQNVSVTMLDQAWLSRLQAL